MFLRIVIFLILITSSLSAESLKNCIWGNKKDIPCVLISKTSNTSVYSERGVNKIIVTKEDIGNSGAVDTNDVLNTEELLWYPNDEKFITDKFITIKTENELHKGEGLESNQDFSSYKIMKPMGSIQLDERDN